MIKKTIAFIMLGMTITPNPVTEPLARSNLKPHNLTLHIVDPSSRNRAELANLAFAIGHHAEVYSDYDELAERSVATGMVVAGDDLEQGGISILMNRLERSNIWLPVIATCDTIGTDRIVTAMKAGALDYLPLPLDESRFSRTLTALAPEAEEYARARRAMFQARTRVAKLSTREREVLDRLSFGNSNKEIARDLDISPRTVEIHRANMMNKLGAQHSAEAVRLQIQAGLG